MTTPKNAPATPLTDAARFTFQRHPGHLPNPLPPEPKEIVPADFARKLERDRARLVEALRACSRVYGRLDGDAEDARALLSELGEDK